MRLARVGLISVSVLMGFYKYITSVLPLENGEMCAVSCVAEFHLWHSLEDSIISSQLSR